MFDGFKHAPIVHARRYQRLVVLNTHLQKDPTTKSCNWWPSGDFWTHFQIAKDTIHASRFPFALVASARIAGATLVPSSQLLVAKHASLYTLNVSNRSSLTDAYSSQSQWEILTIISKGYLLDRLHSRKMLLRFLIAHGFASSPQSRILWRIPWGVK